MKKVIFSLSVIFLIISTIVLSFAHPGKTDEDGGHYDNSSGEYHYHHGYPAHQHKNGVCPYDFKDNTKHTEKRYSYISATGNSLTSETVSITSDKYYNLIRVFIISGFAALALVIFELKVIISNKDNHKAEINRLKSDSEKYRTEKENKISELNKTIEELNSDIDILKTQKDKFKSQCKKYECALVEQFDYKNIHDIITMIPASTSFVLESGRYLPTDLIRSGKYGSYTIYVSSHGLSYHFKRGCSGAYDEINFMQANNYGMSFCKKCSIHQTTQMEFCELWREDFNDLIKLIDENDITIDFSEIEE